jgi:hypothetical protein
MEGDHHQPPARGQQFHSARQAPLDLAELVIHRDPQPLE